ncbi:MAG: hypothetical protein ABIP35_00305 [Ginsengibacter sp.]
MKKIIFLLCTSMVLTTVNAQRKNMKTLKEETLKNNTIQPVKTDKPQVLDAGLLPLAIPEKRVAIIYQNPTIITSVGNNGEKITSKLVTNVQSWSANTVINATPAAAPNNTSEGDFNCTTTTETFSAQSTSFMNASQDKVNQIYPGNIANYNDFFTGTNYVNVPERNAITIVSSNLANTSSNISEVVAKPTMGNVQQAVSNIVRGFSTSTGSAGLQYRVFSSNSEADLAIKLNAGGSYAGFKANADYNKTESSKHFYLTFDIIKPMYTINIQPLAGTAVGYLTNTNTSANGLILINSVTYGTRILANLDIEINTNQDLLDIKASYGQAVEGGISANAGFNYLKNLNTTNKTLNAYVVGGPSNTTILHLETLEADITELLSRCNYQSAAPISYTFADLADNKLGIETATDKVVIKKCFPKDAIVRLNNATITIMTGTDNKEPGSTFNCEIYNRRVDDNGLIAFDIDPNQTNIGYINSSTTTLSLKKSTLANDDDLIRSSFAIHGGKLRVYFRPKAIFAGYDDWKIKNITIDFMFTDQYGKAYPEKILFECKDVNLGRDSRALECWFDGGFKAGSVFTTQ